MITSLLQVINKLFQQVIASLQISSCIKFDFHNLIQLDETERLDASWWQFNLHQANKIHNLTWIKSAAFLHGCIVQKVYSHCLFQIVVTNFEQVADSL